MSFKNIVVAGMWHLGCVIAGCLADKNFKVCGYDLDAEIVNQLKKGKLPIFEPGLDELIGKNVNKGYLSFSSDKEIFRTADLIWVAIDTPVNENDEADFQFVVNFIKSIFPFLQNDSTLIVSSQLPVGSLKHIQKDFYTKFPKLKVDFICIPENLRLGKAIEYFQSPDRFIVGIDENYKKEPIENLLSLYTKNIVWMSITSAEMTKHAINSFLAMSISFINEIALVCDEVGADVTEVEKGLKSEERIGPKAYLKAGSGFAGGTLARDIDYLVKKGLENHLPLNLLKAIKISNQKHKEWLHQKINKEFASLQGIQVGVLGLTYKPGTNTLRRSSSVETCRWLVEQGANVYAYDPIIESAELDFPLKLELSFEALINQVDVIIVATEWPEFKNADLSVIETFDTNKYVFDLNGFLINKFMKFSKVKYFSLGRRL